MELSDCPDCHKMAEDLRDLRAALKKYGRHHRDCLFLHWHKMTGLQRATLKYECTCGFSKYER